MFQRRLCDQEDKNHYKQKYCCGVLYKLCICGPKRFTGRRDQLGWSCCVTLVSSIVGNNTRIIRIILLYHKLPIYYGILQVGGTLKPSVRFCFPHQGFHCNHIVCVNCFFFFAKLSFCVIVVSIWVNFGVAKFHPTANCSKFSGQWSSFVY